MVNLFPAILSMTGLSPAGSGRKQALMPARLSSYDMDHQARLETG